VVEDADGDVVFVAEGEEAAAVDEVGAFVDVGDDVDGIDGPWVGHAVGHDRLDRDNWLARKSRTSSSVVSGYVSSGVKIMRSPRSPAVCGVIGVAIVAGAASKWVTKTLSSAKVAVR
jgi:hypothetical protein